MTERELSKLQKEYRDFFLEKLKLYGVNSPTDLTKEKKSEFFTSIKRDWAKIKIAKKRSKAIHLNQLKTDRENLKHTCRANTSKDSEEKNLARTLIPQEFAQQVIRSQPNIEQTADLKILYTPNSYFEQAQNYCYPVVKMPKKSSSLKLPRLGRSNQKGYKEKEFF